jgi:allophanate hydrolase
VHNLAYVSGGSSSGSAVVVAAGLVPFALGTDTAGSGRVPAAFNHLIGFKPSKGRWSTRGLVPACRTIDCITAFTDDIAGAALIDAVVAGFDAADPYSKPLADRPVGRARIGVAPGAAPVVWRCGSEYLTTARSKSWARWARSWRSITPLQEAAQLSMAAPGWPNAPPPSPAFSPAIRGGRRPVRKVVEPGRDIGAVELFNGIYRLAALKRQADLMWDAIDVLAFPTTGTTYRVANCWRRRSRSTATWAYTNFVNLLDMAAWPCRPVRARMQRASGSR